MVGSARWSQFFKHLKTSWKRFENSVKNCLFETVYKTSQKDLKISFFCG